MKGPNVLLRPLRVEDADREYCAWMNDPAVICHLEARFQTWDLASLREWVEAERKRRYLWAITLHSEMLVHIGNITLGPVNWRHQHADISLMIGRKDKWRKGYASEALNLVVVYAFNTLGLRKLTASIMEGNGASLALFYKAGFRKEGILRKQRWCEGEWQNEVVLGLLVNEQVAKATEG